MEFWDVVRGRHSVRDFKDETVPAEAVERLTLAASLAPSSMNAQPWRFYVATGETRKALGALIAQATIHLTEYIDVLGPDGYEQAVVWFSTLGNAPTLIAVVTEGSDDALDMLNKHLAVGAAVENLLLAAVDEGLGACNITYSHWVEDEIAEMLGLAEDEVVITVIALGWPSAVPAAAPLHNPDVAVWLD
jgi:nitroreductase